MRCQKCDRQIITQPYTIANQMGLERVKKAPYTAIRNPETKVPFFHEKCAHDQLAEKEKKAKMEIVRPEDFAGSV